MKRPNRELGILPQNPENPKSNSPETEINHNLQTAKNIELSLQIIDYVLNSESKDIFLSEENRNFLQWVKQAVPKPQVNLYGAELNQLKGAPVEALIEALRLAGFANGRNYGELIAKLESASTDYFKQRFGKEHGIGLTEQEAAQQAPDTLTEAYFISEEQNWGYRSWLEDNYANQIPNWENLSRQEQDYRLAMEAFAHRRVLDLDKDNTVGEESLDNTAPKSNQSPTSPSTDPSAKENGGKTKKPKIIPDPNPPKINDIGIALTQDWQPAWHKGDQNEINKPGDEEATGGNRSARGGKTEKPPKPSIVKSEDKNPEPTVDQSAEKPSFPEPTEAELAEIRKKHEKLVKNLGNLFESVRTSYYAKAGLELPAIENSKKEDWAEAIEAGFNESGIVRSDENIALLLSIIALDGGLTARTRYNLGENLDDDTNRIFVSKLNPKLIRKYHKDRYHIILDDNNITKLLATPSQSVGYNLIHLRRIKNIYGAEKNRDKRLSLIFADWHYGLYTCRNAGFQKVIAELSGTPIKLTGKFDNETLEAVGQVFRAYKDDENTDPALRKHLDNALNSLQKDFRQSTMQNFVETKTWKTIFNLWKQKHPDLKIKPVVPKIELQPDAENKQAENQDYVKDALNFYQVVAWPKVGEFINNMQKDGEVDNEKQSDLNQPGLKRSKRTNTRSGTTIEEPDSQNQKENPEIIQHYDYKAVKDAMSDFRASLGVSSASLEMSSLIKSKSEAKLLKGVRNLTSNLNELISKMKPAQKNKYFDGVELIVFDEEFDCSDDGRVLFLKILHKRKDGEWVPLPDRSRDAQKGILNVLDAAVKVRKLQKPAPKSDNSVDHSIDLRHNPKINRAFGDGENGELLGQMKQELPSMEAGGESLFGKSSDPVESSVNNLVSAIFNPLNGKGIDSTARAYWEKKNKEGQKSQGSSELDIAQLKVQQELLNKIPAKQRQLLEDYFSKFTFRKISNVLLKPELLLVMQKDLPQVGEKNLVKYIQFQVTKEIMRLIELGDKANIGKAENLQSKLTQFTKERVK